MKINNTLKKISASIAFILILIILLLTASYIFVPKGSIKDFSKNDALINSFMAEKENTIDIIIVGDSEAYSSISPMQLWKNYGYTSYVCATSAQYLSYTEEMLRQVFKRQKPKVVILETYAVYRKILVEKSIITRFENSFSIFKYHDRWKDFKNFRSLKNNDYGWKDDFKGYRYDTDIVKAKKRNYMKKSNETETIPPLNISYVKSIAKLCRENGAEFLLVSTPSCKNWNYKRHNGIEALANELQVQYVDLNLSNEEIAIDWSMDTKDNGDHLNYTGAVKATNYLGKYISENYSMTDNRKNKDYQEWNETLDRYIKEVNKK